ncbi:helix-turn-helix domain-containing protein [Salmonella enterica]
MNQVIQRAINIAGTQAILAQRVGVSQKTIHTWLYGTRFGGHYITDIVRATDGKVTAAELLLSLRK